MKHLPQILAQQRAQAQFAIAGVPSSQLSVAQEGIAQEGFVDGFKDFFTHQATTSDLAIVRKAASTMAEYKVGLTSTRQFVNNNNMAALRYLFKEDQLTGNLVGDINHDVKTVGMVNDVLRNIVELLKKSKPEDRNNEIENGLISVLKEARVHLDDVAMLGNYYFSFGARGTGDMLGNHIDEDIKAKLRLGNNLTEAAVGLVFYALDKKKADGLFPKINEKMDFDLNAFKSATTAYAKMLGQSAALIEEFIGEYKRSKRHDSKHVRHVLRYGHNVCGVLVAIASVTQPFLNYMRSQLKTGDVAMEGFTDSVKNGVNLLKSKFSPNDETKAKAQIEVLTKLKDDAEQLKKYISSGADIKSTSVKLTQAAKNFPVSAQTPDELVRNLSAWRKQTAAEVTRISKLTDKAEVESAIAKMKEQAKVKGKIADNMVFTKDACLKLLSEMIALIDLSVQTCKRSLELKTEAGEVKPSMESMYIAMESMEMTIAMEGFWSKVFGYYLLITGYASWFYAIIVACWTVFMILTGAGVFAVLFTAGAAGVNWFLGSLFVEAGRKMIDDNQDDGEYRS